MADHPKRLMIYAHFDHENKVRAYTEFALQKSREVCQDVIFISTSSLSEIESRKAHPYCSAVCVKNNAGFDFGMWKHGLSQIKLEEWDELVLMNSSVYGPVFPLQDAFDFMAKDGCDFWGMTENYEPERHLQSYFIVFRKKVLRSSLFPAFWNSVLEYRDKSQVIRSYEIGLSRWLAENGFAMGVYCPWPKLIQYRNSSHKKRIRRFCNPSVRFPSELLTLKVPFVKREVFRANTFGADLDALKESLARTEYPSSLILDETPVSANLIKSDPQPVCPLCGEKGKMLYKQLKDRRVIDGLPVWNIRYCQSRVCGAAWLDPRPQESEMWKAYLNYYTYEGNAAYMDWYDPPQYGPAGRWMLKTLNKILRRLRLHRKRYDFYYHGLSNSPPGRLLEIGCGGGGRLLGLKQFGWEVEGQEVDLKAVEYCRKQGLDVRHGDLESCCFPEKSYDVILMSHVLEHLHDPVDLLRRCRGLLKPGGRIVVSTPNMQSLGRLIYRKRWLALDPPRHITLLNSKALRGMLKEAGFESIRIETITYNMELISMHSRDILRNGFSDSNPAPRINKELVPVFMQLCALILGAVFPWIGEECFAQAEK